MRILINTLEPCRSSRFCLPSGKRLEIRSGGDLRSRKNPGVCLALLTSNRASQPGLISPAVTLLLSFLLLSVINGKMPMIPGSDSGQPLVPGCSESVELSGETVHQQQLQPEMPNSQSRKNPPRRPHSHTVSFHGNNSAPRSRWSTESGPMSDPHRRGSTVIGGGKLTFKLLNLHPILIKIVLPFFILFKL